MLDGTATARRSDPAKPSVQRLFDGRRNDARLLVTRTRHAFSMLLSMFQPATQPFIATLKKAAASKLIPKTSKTEVASELFHPGFVNTRAVRATEDLRNKKVAQGTCFVIGIQRAI